MGCTGFGPGRIKQVVADNMYTPFNLTRLRLIGVGIKPQSINTAHYQVKAVVVLGWGRTVVEAGSLSPGQAARTLAGNPLLKVLRRRHGTAKET